jgi:hypothetical protein
MSPINNISRPTAESRATVSIIRGAKPSWQRGQTRLTFERKIGNSIAATDRAESNVPFNCRSYNSRRRAHTLSHWTPNCFHKIEFSFLNGNLMVPEVGRYLNSLARMVRALNIVEGDEPWV